MAVCGHCVLCGSKFDCGPMTSCMTCDIPRAVQRRPAQFHCPCGQTHLVCAGCLDVMHHGSPLDAHQMAVLVSLIAASRRR